MKTIEVIDLEKLDSSAITVVDVRSSEDYSKGTFNNAISIPKSDFYNNVSNIEKNKPVYVLCYTGDNSVEIVDYLNENGYDAYNIVGGYRAYLRLYLERSLAEDNDTEKITKEIERSIIKKFRKPIWSKFIKSLKEYQLINEGDKVGVIGPNGEGKSTLFKIITGEMEPDEGTYKWGVTTSQSYFPKDNTEIFDTDMIIVDWLTQFSEIKDATYVRGFLGRMLFPGEDGVKKMRVLSGGEKVRVLFSRMMIEASNVLILDEPTDHLDMESITALNNGLIKFPGVLLFASRDHQIVQTTANRIIEFMPNGSIIDKITTYDEYLESDEMARKRSVYTMASSDEEDN